MSKKKKEVFMSEDKFAKSHFVMSKNKFIIGCVCAAALIGGVGGYAVYKTINGSVTQKDIFLRAFDTLNEGKYTLNAKILSADNSSIDQTEIQTGIVNLKVGYYGYNLKGNDVNETIREYDISYNGEEKDRYHYYNLINKDNKMITISNAMNGKYYERKNSSSFTQMLGQYCSIFNNYNKLTKDGNCYKRTSTFFDVLGDGRFYLYPLRASLDLSDVKVDVTIELKDNLISKFYIGTAEEARKIVYSEYIGKDLTFVIPSNTVYLSGEIKDYNKTEIDASQFPTYYPYVEERTDLYKTKFYDIISGEGETKSLTLHSGSFKTNTDYVVAVTNENNEPLDNEHTAYTMNESITKGTITINNKIYTTIKSGTTAEYYFYGYYKLEDLTGERASFQSQ